MTLRYTTGHMTGGGYSSLPNNRVYTAIYFPKFSLVHALIKDAHDYLFSSFGTPHDNKKHLMFLNCFKFQKSLNFVFLTFPMYTIIQDLHDY